MGIINNIFNIKQDSPPCILQCGGTVQILTTIWSVYDKKLARPIGVCKRCGHVQIALIFEVDEYKQLNNNFFKKYSPRTSIRLTQNNKKKSGITIKRLSPYLSRKGPYNLLDAGAGEGWSKNVADHFNCDYYVVEPNQRLADKLVGNGAKLASDSIDTISSDFMDFFDVIILRHTLEHLLNPVSSIKKLSQCLRPDGIIYVAVPNFLKANPKDGFRTDWLRPSHISYFTPDKLEWVFHLSGIVVDCIYNEGELWAVGKPGKASFFFENEFGSNKVKLKFMKKKWRLADSLNMLKIIARKIINAY